MSAAPLRTAVIGTSWWAVGAHLPGLHALPFVEVVALCGRDPQRLARVAAQFHIPTTFTDYEVMLAEARPDVVVIATPNHLHAPMALAALEAGAHVICEKPLALDTANAVLMQQRAAQLHRQTLTVFTYRGMGGPRFIKQLMSDGYVGRLHHVQASYLHGSWLNPQRPASWKTSTAQGGSGVLGDLGAHVIDMLLWWGGPLARVSGSLQTVIPQRPDANGHLVPVETDDSAALLMEFVGGGQATVQLSRVAPERHNYQRIELYGSAGTLVYEYDEPLAYMGRVLGARAGEGEVRPLPIPEAYHVGQDFAAVYRALTESFFARVRDESAPEATPSFAEGVAVQRVIDAAARSAHSGQWESV